MTNQPNQPNAQQQALAQAAPRFQDSFSPMAGIGSFATVPILRGSLILQEHPFLCLGPNESIPPRDSQNPQWQTWLNLREHGTPLSEIFRTTSLRCGTSRRANQEVEVSGVFLRAARFNSSCRPNVHAHWNQTNMCMEFRALRNIPANEELCICYDPRILLFPRAERQRRLYSKFGFVCNCNCCVNPSILSDNRRNALRAVVDTIDTIPLQDRIQSISAAVATLHDEGLYHYGDTLHFDLHLARKGELDNNAMLCLVTARNLARAMVGIGDPRVVQMTASLPTSWHNDNSGGCHHPDCT